MGRGTRGRGGSLRERCRPEGWKGEGLCCNNPHLPPPRTFFHFPAVIIACRNVARGEEVKAGIVASTEQSGRAKPDIEVWGAIGGRGGSYAHRGQASLVKQSGGTSYTPLRLRPLLLNPPAGVEAGPGLPQVGARVRRQVGAVGPRAPHPRQQRRGAEHGRCES